MILLMFQKLAMPNIFPDDTNPFFSDFNLSNLVKTANCELYKIGLCCWFKLNKLSLNINRLIVYSLNLQKAFTLKTLLSTLTIL